MNPKLLAGCAGLCAAAIALSGCSTLGASAGGPSGGSGALLDAVRAISANCAGAFNANLIFAPPLPPSGSLVVNQTCGTAAPVKPLAPAPTPPG